MGLSSFLSCVGGRSKHSEGPKGSRRRKWHERPIKRGQATEPLLDEVEKTPETATMVRNGSALDKEKPKRKKFRERLDALRRLLKRGKKVDGETLRDSLSKVNYEVREENVELLPANSQRAEDAYVVIEAHEKSETKSQPVPISNTKRDRDSRETDIPVTGKSQANNSRVKFTSTAAVADDSRAIREETFGLRLRAGNTKGSVGRKQQQTTETTEDAEVQLFMNEVAALTSPAEQLAQQDIEDYLVPPSPASPRLAPIVTSSDTDLSSTSTLTPTRDLQSSSASPSSDEGEEEERAMTSYDSSGVSVDSDMTVRSAPPVSSFGLWAIMPEEIKVSQEILNRGYLSDVQKDRQRGGDEGKATISSTAFMETNIDTVIIEPDVVQEDHREDSGISNGNLSTEESPADDIEANFKEESAAFESLTTESSVQEDHFDSLDQSVADEMEFGTLQSTKETFSSLRAISLDTNGHVPNKDVNGPGEDLSSPVAAPQDNYKIWNGQSLRVSTLHECLSCGGSFWNKEDMPHELAYLQISESDYHAACEHLRACTKIRQYSLCYNHWLHSAVFLLVFLASWCAAFGIWTSQGLSARVGAGVVVLAAVAVTAICSCVCGCVRRRLNSRTRRCLAKVNEIFSRYKLLAGLVEEGALTCYRLSMHFIYFDLGPCMEKMTEDLNKLVTMKKSKHDKPHVIVSSDDMGVLEDTDMVLLSGDITEKQRQDFARQLLFRYCDAFINDIVANRIRKIPPGRHSRDGACLCQYVQQRFFNLKNEDLK